MQYSLNRICINPVQYPGSWRSYTESRRSRFSRRLRGRSDAFGSEARRVKVKQVGEQSEKFHGGGGWGGTAGNSAEHRVYVRVRGGKDPLHAHREPRALIYAARTDRESGVIKSENRESSNVCISNA